MPITFGSVTPATPSFSWNGSAFEASVSHTLAAGSTQIALALHGPNGGTITAVTWGGVALTLRADVNDGNNGRIRYYDLDAPASGTANIVVTCASDLSGAGFTIFGISGVDTGTPRRTAATANGFGGTASVAATTVAGDVVVGLVSTVNTATADGTLTTLNANLLSGEYGSAAYRTASGTSTTVQWTQTSENWAVAAIPYVPASGDTTPPTLSAPVGSATASTTATVGATTNEGNGTLYAVVTGSATQPSIAQIKAGNDHTGSAAVWSGNVAVSSTGAKTLNATGLTAGSSYYVHLVHSDAATNDSNRVTSSQWTQLVKKVKLKLALAAAGETVDGIVWANQSGAIAGAEIGEFTGQTIGTGSGADAGLAVLKVPVSVFGGGSLSVGDTVQVYVRKPDLSKDSDVFPATVIEE